MNQIVDTLISALGFTRRDQTANDLQMATSSPMIDLRVTDLALVVGGGGDDTGPRGGWIAA